MVGPPSRRLARTPARLATDPLRGKGAYHRSLLRLSSSETPAADYNLNLSSHKIIDAGARHPKGRSVVRLPAYALKGIASAGSGCATYAPTGCCPSRALP